MTADLQLASRDIATLVEEWAEGIETWQPWQTHLCRSSCGSPIQCIHEFIVYHHQCLVQHHLTWRTSQTSFKWSYNWNTPPGSILVTLSVSSLYINTLRVEAEKWAQKWLHHLPTGSWLSYKEPTHWDSSKTPNKLTNTFALSSLQQNDPWIWPYTELWRDIFILIATSLRVFKKPFPTLPKWPTYNVEYVVCSMWER